MVKAEQFGIPSMPLRTSRRYRSRSLLVELMKTRGIMKMILWVCGLGRRCPITPPDRHPTRYKAAHVAGPSRHA